MAADATQAPSYGWIKTYRVTENREVVMTCQNPAGGPDVEVRALPIELDSMLRQAREPRKPDRRKRTS